MQHLAEITGSIQTPQADLPRTDNAERSKIEALRHQVALLLSMVSHAGRYSRLWTILTLSMLAR